ncbi:S-adenosyl-L-methionine-dependent methyltransferase [Chlamydoabsidia padenii]|nr:S-adenosyl-L-methionine-dependent methyltransferase [Chlamydoabsidia padenii]
MTITMDTEETKLMRTLHGQLVFDENSFLKKLGQKDDTLNNQVAKSYQSLWQDQDKLKDNDSFVDDRREKAQSMTNSFYDLVTDFYEYGWGKSFHFARLYKGDTFEQNINRHEGFLALKLGLNQNMHVLDVGCGVGGPLREIVKASGGAHVTGINNNAYQIERCLAYSTKYGLSSHTDFIKGDFTNMPMDDATFDSVFSVEATVHAPRLEMVYAEIFRVLKPGGRFACYEWCTTDNYDENDMTLKKVIHAIEQGNSISKLYSKKECLAALRSVGFNVVEEWDAADPLDGATVPWYYTLSRPDPGLRGWLRSPWGRRYTDYLLTFLNKINMVPLGVLETSQLLNAAADNLVLGGELGIFTPMFFFMAEKPL